MLDDKNRIIEALKKQVENQKMQLTYYIKKDMNPKMIQKLSESCSPQVSDESLPLNLAINKFCRQNGLQTRLSCMYERMNRLDTNLLRCLRDQEYVLEQIVKELCNDTKRKFTGVPKVELKFQFGSPYVTNPNVVDLFIKLLNATLHLKRKLIGFKICCDRVLIVEEERNGIVEQVYAMPTEQRCDCNYLLGLQMEKAEMENEIRRLSAENVEKQDRVVELNVVEKLLHNLRWELDSSFLKDEDSCISEMLKKVNSEARVLLAMTQEQKHKFKGEAYCDRTLFYIRTALNNGDVSEEELRNMGIKDQEGLRLYETIKKEIDSIRKSLRKETEKEITKAADENKMLRDKNAKLVVENEKMTIENKRLKEEVEQMKLEQKNGYRRLKHERDAYKSQVDDLQAIREAYAQLVDKQPSTLQIEREFTRQIDDRDKIISDYERKFAVMVNRIKRDKEKISDQNEQIVILNRVLKLNKSRDETICDQNPPKKETKIPPSTFLNPTLQQTKKFPKLDMPKNKTFQPRPLNANDKTINEKQPENEVSNKNKTSQFLENKNAPSDDAEWSSCSKLCPLQDQKNLGDVQLKSVTEDKGEEQ
ncbi:myosin-J heavy chain-like isoform X1 [Sitophilus oryzae]|nr:myosin-J heavy chain-like isoform X1 [Sitophilus oryzae]